MCRQVHFLVSILFAIVIDTSSMMEWRTSRVMLLLLLLSLVSSLTAVAADSTYFLRQSNLTGSSKQLDIQIPRACVPPHDVYPFCDPSLPLDVRLDDLISRLTLEEKPYLLTARQSPEGYIDRLGIPEYNWGANCMHGVQSRCGPDGRCATSFPNPNTLGASYNRTSWMAMGHAIGIELRAQWLQNVGQNNPHNLPHLGLNCWSPNVDISRDPRWGRNVEVPSEDPYLCGIYGESYTKGLQGNYSGTDPRFFLGVATLKHYAANTLEGRYWTDDGRWSETDGYITRYNFNQQISAYDLATSYLPPFRRSIQVGRAAGVMCSYSRINDIPACAHKDLLITKLRQEWNFRGYVTSDSGAIQLMQAKHNYVDDEETAAALALDAGCDIESAGWEGDNPSVTGGVYIDTLRNAVTNGAVDESAIDNALRNALGVRFRLGLFDPIEDQPYWRIPPEVVGSEEHVKLAKEATAQGMVLLKNDNAILPLNPAWNVALIGPHLDNQREMLGNYLGEICKDDPGLDCLPNFRQGFTDVTSNQVGILRSERGCDTTGDDRSRFGLAIDAALKSDVVVFIGGSSFELEDEMLDRPDIRLPAIQEELIRELSYVNPNIVLVLMHGGMVGVDNVLEYVPGLVSTGFPGAFAGTVIPRVLYGLEPRAWGKSTITWYRNSIVDDLNMMDMSMTKFPGRTYRYYRGGSGKEPHFTFGTGLNPLTIFQFGELATSPVDCIETDVSLEISRQTDMTVSCPFTKAKLSLSVTNEGMRSGDEVVMVYIVPLDIPEEEPASSLIQQLIGFERVRVDVGVSVPVSFNIGMNKFLLANGMGIDTIFPGRYIIRVSNGNGQLKEVTVYVSDSDWLSFIDG